MSEKSSSGGDRAREFLRIINEETQRKIDDTIKPLVDRIEELERRVSELETKQTD